MTLGNTWSIGPSPDPDRTRPDTASRRVLMVRRRNVAARRGGLPHGAHAQRRHIVLGGQPGDLHGLLKAIEGQDGRFARGDIPCSRTGRSGAAGASLDPAAGLALARGRSEDGPGQVRLRLRGAGT